MPTWKDYVIFNWFWFKFKEMTKEIRELKKEQNKNNQLSDEDLHFFDPDYGVDYNINANLGYNPGIPNLYTNYQPGRIQNPTPLAAYPGLYPGLYPGFYGPLALPQQGNYYMHNLIRFSNVDGFVCEAN